ncbi:hypothetical protein GPX89_09210 [Nocardia sp. ET3-3]|uniref:Uncharacterized protein n=1 Tax=Nocardia terrae TaxID=2675851 RepID=A0A7K1USX0_9NOCA|nr:hypothetical protein [Nocardia terrae]MVU77425.1 hypothetical protein [Nocardia terrae]
MPGNEVDEVARNNWPQLMALLMQLFQKIQQASADGSIRLNRTQYKQFVTELRDAQQEYARQVRNTQQWYQARTGDYQREAAAAKARAEAGASPQDQAKAAAYLAGLRATIEHTIHDTALTPEQRGQVVQALDGIDADPSKPVAANLFPSIQGTAAVRARYAAAASEHVATERRAQLTANGSVTSQSKNAEVAQQQRENARRFDELSRRLQELEHKLNKITAQQNSTAKIGPAIRPPSAKVNRARQEASRQAAAQSNSQIARPQAEAEARNGAEVMAEAEAAVEQAEISAEQAEGPTPRTEHTAEAQQVQTNQEAAAASEAVQSAAQMQAEA